MISPESDWSQAGTIWMVDLDQPLPAITPRIPVIFRPAGIEDATVLAETLHSGSPEEISRRFETGRSCYTAWTEGQLAAYGWASFEEEYIGEMDLRLRLLPGEVYIWDCVTLPAFRQKRLFSALLVYILHELRAGLVCRAWIGANQENLASQRGIARAGFHSVADLVVTRGPARRRYYMEGYPGVPESLAAEARRVFLGNFLEIESASRPSRGVV